MAGVYVKMQRNQGPLPILQNCQVALPRGVKASFSDFGLLMNNLAVQFIQLQLLHSDPSMISGFELFSGS
jgi:hypothetical protein